MSSHPCPVCDSDGTIIHERVRDLLFAVPGTWSYARCDSARCRSVYPSPRPALDEVPGLYRSYHTHPDFVAPDGAASTAHVAQASPPRRLARGLLRRTLRPMARAVLDRATRRVIDPVEARRHAGFHLDDLVPGALLEIGCGSGRNLASLHERGWAVVGQEIDPIAAQGARRRGFAVEVAPVGECWPGASFDVVLLSHVAEHLFDVRRELAEAAGRLVPGGRIVVVTPDPDSPGHRWFRSRWRGLEPPRHLQLLTPDALRTLLEGCGLEVRTCGTTPAESRFVLATSVELWLLWLPRPLRSALANAILLLLFLVRPRLLRREGEVCVAVAIRP